LLLDLKQQTINQCIIMQIPEYPQSFEKGQIHFHFAMDKQLYFELLVELSHEDTWVHYYFVYYKTFVISSFFFFLPMIPSLIMFCFFFELRFVPRKYSLRSVLSLWCQSRRLLSFLLRLFPLFKYKTYIVSKSQLAT
jgi:hypothetical protein